MEIKINLPRPHGEQRSFMRSAAKRKVIVAGRRGGKTTGVSMLAIEAALAGRRVLEAAPMADQTSAFWEACKGALAPMIDKGYCTKHETTRTLEIKGMGRIRAKTAWNADTLRGDYADLLILDEYSLMSPSAWDEVGAPMLLDNNGDAVFIFTPKRKNHGYKMFMRAKSGDSGRWQAWHFTSLDNPHLSREALEDITQDMSDDAYKQEVLAQFLDNEGAVFSNIAANLIPAFYDESGYWHDNRSHDGHTTICGIDWAKDADHTVFSVGCVECESEIALFRFGQVDYTYQRARLGDVQKQWNISQHLPERNSIGEPNIELIIREGLPVAYGPDGKPGFYTSASSKPQLIENLKLSLARAEWKFLDIPEATAELEAYEQKVNDMGRSKYSAPEGMNDDTVIARALQRWLGNRGWLSFSIGEE